MFLFTYLYLACQDRLRITLPQNAPLDTQFDGVYTKTPIFVPCDRRPDVALYTRINDNIQYNLFFCEEPPPVISQYFVTIQNDVQNQSTSFMNVRNVPTSLQYCEITNLNLYYNCTEVNTCPAENIYGNVVIQNESDEPQIINLSTSDILKIVLPTVFSWLLLWLLRAYCYKKADEEDAAKQPLNKPQVVNNIPTSRNNF